MTMFKAEEGESRMIDTKILAMAGALVIVLGAGSAFADGDAAKGEKVFAQCKTCHSLEAGRNMIGPSLHGIIGRKAGTAPNYKYSAANSKSGVEWTEDNLKKYLKNPREFMPGNKMTFAGLRKEDDIENVIAYLKAKAK